MIVQRNGEKAAAATAVVPRKPGSGVPWYPRRWCRRRSEAGEGRGALNTYKEREREIKALRAPISRLSTTNFRISESPDLETVLREALEPLRQGVHQLPSMGVRQMPPYG